MAFIAGIGQNLFFPSMESVNYAAGFSTTLLIDATGEKMAVSGNFWTPDQLSKTINTAGFLAGTIVSAGGSTIRCSLQDHDLTAGTPLRPTGTQDEFRDALLSTVTSNSWFTTGLLTSDGTDVGVKRTVAHGERLSFVVEFDAGGRLGADSMMLRGLTPWLQSPGGSPVPTLFTGSWAAQTPFPCLLFTCSDGSIATLQGLSPVSNVTGVVSFGSASSPDEHGIEFVAPITMKADGIWGYVSLTSATLSDYELVLYENGTQIAVISVDAGDHATTSLRITNKMFSSTQTIVQGRTYIISIRPTTTNTISTLVTFVQSAGHWAVHSGPEGSRQVTRTDGGAWTASATTRVQMGLSIASIDNTSGSGGGIPWPIGHKWHRNMI